MPKSSLLTKCTFILTPRFNFKNDGKISKEEVRLVLSYTPIRNKKELSGFKEGNYSFEQGRS